MKITGAGFPPRVYAAGVLAALVDGFGRAELRPERAALLGADDNVTLTTWSGNRLAVRVNGVDMEVSVTIPRTNGIPAEEPAEEPAE